MSDKTILVIDDSFTSLLLMDYSLKDEGYKTNLASTVKEAKEMIKLKIPDLIILDLNLPEISGYDFLRMKEAMRVENIPVIIVSALNSPDSIQITKTLGASDFFSKPVDLKLIIQKIKSLIG